MALDTSVGTTITGASTVVEDVELRDDFIICGHCLNVERLSGARARSKALQS